MELRDDEHLDRMCVTGKLSENTRTHADYEITSDVWAPDPRYKSRSIRTGAATALIRIHKASGQIEIINPFPKSANPAVLMAISHKITKNHQEGTYPDEVVHASG